MKYNFLESKFGNKFCTREISQIERLINSSLSFTVAGMPGVGVTIFLKYLVSTKVAYFIYVDSYLMTNLTKEEFFRQLLKQLGEESLNDAFTFDRCLQKLGELSEKHNKIVLIFNRFDQLKSIFDATFFSNIWALRNINPLKIVIISTANRPLSEIASKDLSSVHMQFFTRVVYLKPYSVTNLSLVASAHLKSNLIENKGALNTAIKLSGGHYQLFQLLLKSARLSNPLQDQFIKLQLKELLSFITYKQRKTLKNLAASKRIENIDEYLIEIGLIKKVNRGFELFTPLLSKYIMEHHPKRIPLKEAKLFSLLKSNLGKTITKEEIFKHLWPGKNNNLDWTLNSLIYRLKKNSTFQASGYVLENHKKLGFILFKD